MIINQTHGFIFVHVPKAAGTSVTNFLSTLSRYCDLEVGGTRLGEAIQAEFRKRHKLSKHSSAREIREVVGDDVWSKSFTFGFARNPYERTYSLFKFLQRMAADPKFAALPKVAPMAGIATFGDFVRSDYFQTDGMDRILKPQLFWLRRDLDTELMAVNYVGRVETMNESMAEIAERVGVKGPEGGVPKMNKSDRSGEGPTVWEELERDGGVEELIWKRYAGDFRVLGYERGKRTAT